MCEHKIGSKFYLASRQSIYCYYNNVDKVNVIIPICNHCNFFLLSCLIYGFTHPIQTFKMK